VAKDKIDLVVDRIEDLKESTNKRLDQYNDLLEDHIRRTNILEDLHMDNQKRIEMLEEPQKALHYLKKVIIYVGAISAGVISVIKLLEYLP
jgi:CHASE3 domain sensor protein